jgi:hypothetical protein
LLELDDSTLCVPVKSTCSSGTLAASAFPDRVPLVSGWLMVHLAQYVYFETLSQLNPHKARANPVPDRSGNRSERGRQTDQNLPHLAELTGSVYPRPPRRATISSGTINNRWHDLPQLRDILSRESDNICHIIRSPISIDHAESAGLAVRWSNTGSAAIIKDAATRAYDKFKI